MRHLKTLDSVLDCLAVESLENGNMIVDIRYKTAKPDVDIRMEIADEIAELLYKHLGKNWPGKHIGPKRRTRSIDTSKIPPSK